MSSDVSHFLIAVGMVVLPPVESEQNVMFLLREPSCLDKCRAGGLAHYQEGDESWLGEFYLRLYCLVGSAMLPCLVYLP